jgi:MtaA/CmuA family methyltransferase
MMTPKELIVRTIRGEPAERVPLVPYISQFAAVDLGVNYTRCCREGRLLADTLAHCRERYGYDAFYISTDSCMEAEAMGCTVQWFDNDVPTIAGHPWQDCELADCHVPCPDPTRDGRMPMYQEVIGRLRERTDDQFGIFTGSDGPLTILSHLRGLNSLMVDLIEEPETCRRLLLEAAQVTITFNLANLRAGATVLHVGDPAAGLLGPKMFRSLLQPALERIVGALRAEGGIVLGHFCGNTSAILDDLVGIGFDVLNIDSQLGLESARGQAGRVCLMGDLNPVRVLMNGTPAVIEQAIIDRLTLLKDTRRFILGSGCHFPAETPAANVRAFVEAGRRHGEYGLTPAS